MSEPADKAARRALRATFDTVAERYDAARPHYPRELVDDLLTLAGLGPGARVLEIGCGTGQLTVDLVRRGLEVTAIELGPSLAALARRNLAAFPAARVVVGAFEDVPVSEPVDAVVAATSFHWLPPDVRVRRSVEALRAGGSVAIVDVRHVAGGSDTFFSAVQSCYERFDPRTPPGLRLPPVDALPPAFPELDASPLLRTVRRRRHAWEVGYSTTGYRELLLTYSNHLALPADRRDGLLDCVSGLIDDRFGGAVTKRYLGELVVAGRR